MPLTMLADLLKHHSLPQWYEQLLRRYKVKSSRAQQCVSFSHHFQSLAQFSSSHLPIYDGSCASSQPFRVSNNSPLSLLQPLHGPPKMKHNDEELSLKPRPNGEAIERKPTKTDHCYCVVLALTSIMAGFNGYFWDLAEPATALHAITRMEPVVLYGIGTTWMGAEIMQVQMGRGWTNERLMRVVWTMSLLPFVVLGTASIVLFARG